MYCPNCGKEINDGAAFCPHCGSAVEEQPEAVEEPAAETKAAEEPPVDAPSDEKKQKKEKKAKEKKPVGKKGKIAAAIVAVIAVVLAIVLVTLLTQKRATAYWDEKLLLEGPNGYAEAILDAKYSLDTFDLYCDMFGVSEDKLLQLQDMDADDEYQAFRDTLFDNVNVSYLSETKNLSNGDTVDVRAVINYDALNSIYGVKHKLKGPEILNKTYTISGLTDPVNVDLVGYNKCFAHFEDNKGTSWLWYGFNNFKPVTWEEYTLQVDEEYDGRGSKFDVYDSVLEEVIYSAYTKIPDKYYLDFEVGGTNKVTFEGDTDRLLKYGFKVDETEKTFTTVTSDYLKDPSVVGKNDVKDWAESALKFSDSYKSIESVGYFGLKNPRNQGDHEYANAIYCLAKTEDGKYEAVVYPAVVYEKSSRAVGHIDDESSLNIEGLDNSFKSVADFKKAITGKGYSVFTEFDESWFQ